jgi:hypothetical protein
MTFGGVRRLFLLSFVGLGAVIGPVAAPAQTYSPKPDQARSIMLDYARCMVKREHDRAAKILLDNADNQTIEREYSRVIDGGCLRMDVDKIEFDDDLYRYALADALVGAEFAVTGPTDFSDRPPLAHLAPPAQADIDAALAKVKPGKKRDALMRGFEAQRVVAGLSQYGECVVRADPTNTRLWILTNPGSPEEAERIDALRHTFGICLKDGKVAFSKATLRGTVALNYYRLAHAPRAH